MKNDQIKTKLFGDQIKQIVKEHEGKKKSSSNLPVGVQCFNNIFSVPFR